MNLIVIGCGGFIGAILRYQVSGWVYRLAGSSLPYGTLAVNVIGSFVLGFFLTLIDTKFVVPDPFRSFLAIGVLGAFTTFSTFSFETIALIQGGMVRQAFSNILLNVIFALAAVWLGIISAKFV